jgi:hypothetical protein
MQREKGCVVNIIFVPLYVEIALNISFEETCHLNKIKCPYVTA